MKSSAKTWFNCVEPPSGCLSSVMRHFLFGANVEPYLAIHPLDAFMVRKTPIFEHAREALSNSPAGTYGNYPI